MGRGEGEKGGGEHGKKGGTSVPAGPPLLTTDRKFENEHPSMRPGNNSRILWLVVNKETHNRTPSMRPGKNSRIL